VATSGDLTRGLAEKLGLPESALGTLYRRLREAGEMPKAGRGPKSSAPMTARSASTLLTTLGGRFVEIEPVKDVIEKMRRVKSVESKFSPIASRDVLAFGAGVFRFPELKMPVLDKLGPEHSIEDAIEALIESYMIDPLCPEDDPFGNHWWRARKLFDDRDLQVSISVQFRGLTPSAEIEIEIFPMRRDSPLALDHWKLKVRYEDLKRVSAVETQGLEGLHAYASAYFGDFESMRRFGDLTLSEAAFIIEDGEVINE
jgi:hypothetical protein